MQVLMLVASFVLLLGGAIGFTNAVEWAGRRLDLGAGVVGSILAAVATALPESVIPIVAILSGEESGQVAIGAIIGAPFLLGTLAMVVVGVSVHAFARRRDQGSRLELDRRTTLRDLVVFLVAMVPALGLGLIDVKALHVIGAILLVLGYAAYVWRSVKKAGSAEEEEPKPLYFDRSKDDPPRGFQIILQMALSVAAIVGGAQLFVTVIEHLATALALPALVLALVLAPLATEMPEKANSILWVRRGKDALALGNITGAMVFQSMIPVAVGMAFTPWRLEVYALLAGGCALVGAALTLVVVRRSGRFAMPAVICWAVLYAGFVVTVLTTA